MLSIILGILLINVHLLNELPVKMTPSENSPTLSQNSICVTFYCQLKRAAATEYITTSRC